MWYQNILKPVLFQLDAETAHDLAYVSGRILSDSEAACDFIAGLTGDVKSLEPVTLWGLPFRNRVGLAAGFDKNGHLPNILSALGFGFIEIGSITALKSPGNKRPRMFRLPLDEALVNRMGLNNDGAQVITDRLLSRPKPGVPLGLNIAKTHNPTILGDLAIEDYCVSFRHAVMVADYITVNISCPNTEEGKTFEDPAALNQLLSVLMREPRIRDNHAIPVLVKISADLDETQRAELIALCESHHVDGYVAVNTSSLRVNLPNSSESEVLQIGKGGLSGSPLFQRACNTVSHIKQLTNHKKPVIGVGGIVSEENALTMVDAGADLIQIYSGLVFQGPAFPARIAGALRR